MYNYKAKIINVVDGDTMDVKIDLGFGIYHETRIRLIGIDTPEIYHPKSPEERQHGLSAKKFVQSKYGGAVGTLITTRDKRGKYGRYLADFYLEDQSLVEDLKENDFEKREEY